ncbi:MAG: hypothetical protein ACOYY2_14655, partial [Actinomycetota bacterium]
MEVGQHEQGNPTYPKVTQAPVRRSRVRPGVHDHRLPRAGRQDEGVALPDVAAHQQPSGRGPVGQETDRT